MAQSQHHLATGPDARGSEPPAVTPLEQLDADWPGWRFWKSDAGTTMATRRRDLSDREIAAGLAQSLPFGADHRTDLRAQLAAQRVLEDELSADS